MIEVENTDVNIVRNCIPIRNFMPASAYGLKAISDWFFLKKKPFYFSSTKKIYSQGMLFRFMSQLEYKMRIVCKIQMKNVQGHNSVT